MKKYILLLTGIAIFCIGNHHLCLAGDIEKGTLSIGGSSNALIQSIDSDEFGDGSEISLSSEIGYFFWDNIEIGSALALSFIDSDQFDSTAYMLIPFIRYHFPLNDKSNIFVGVGAGIGRMEYEDSQSDSDSDLVAMIAETGWEYAFTDNVALNLGIRAQKRDIDSDRIDDTETVIGSEMRLKIYF